MVLRTGIWQRILHIYGGINTRAIEDYHSDFRGIRDFIGCDGLLICLSMMKAVHELDKLREEQEIEIFKLKKQIEILKAKNEILRENSNIPEGKVTLELAKAGVNQSKKVQADISIISEHMARGKTQQEIAELLNVSRATLWRIRKNAAEIK